MIRGEDPIADAAHVTCDQEIARLRAERDEARAQRAEAIAERDRWIARNRLLEAKLDGIRDIVR